MNQYVCLACDADWDETHMTDCPFCGSKSVACQFHDDYNDIDGHYEGDLGTFNPHSKDELE